MGSLQLLLLQDGKLLGREPVADSLFKVFNVPAVVITSDPQTQSFVIQSARVSLQIESRRISFCKLYH